MLDIEKDIKVRIRFNAVGKRLAYADLTICDLIFVSGFEITKGKNNIAIVIFAFKFDY